MNSMRNDCVIGLAFVVVAVAMAAGGVIAYLRDGWPGLLIDLVSFIVIVWLVWGRKSTREDRHD